MYNTTKVLEMAPDEEAKKKPIGPKRPRNRPRKRPIEELKKKNRKEILKISSSDLKIVLNKNVSYKMRARKAE